MFIENVRRSSKTCDGPTSIGAAIGLFGLGRNCLHGAGVRRSFLLRTSQRGFHERVHRNSLRHVRRHVPRDCHLPRHQGDHHRHLQEEGGTSCATTSPITSGISPLP
jgi:hypothetical protein